MRKPLTCREIFLTRRILSLARIFSAQNMLKILTMKFPVLVVCVCALGLAGCAKKGLAPGDAVSRHRNWSVYKDGRKVLTFNNRPGTLTSQVYLPPGVEPDKHPFLSAHALAPLEEENLTIILDKSKSLEEFLSLLKEGGYTVKEVHLP